MRPESIQFSQMYQFFKISRQFFKHEWPVFARTTTFFSLLFIYSFGWLLQYCCSYNVKEGKDEVPQNVESAVIRSVISAT